MVSAPFTAAALEPALRPFGQATMLAAQAYTSVEVLSWEVRHLFAGTWTCVGREDELRGHSTDEDGGVATQRALVVGDVPVLLTWTTSPDERDGPVVRALANTCRHRGHELLPAGRTTARRSLVCPYHAWTYSLLGELTTAPGFRDVAGFDVAEHGLVPLPVQLWHGWVFVNATGDAASFADHLGAMGSLVEPYAPERLVRLARHDYTVAANWKVVVENYHECYHCPLIHPELCQVSPPTSGDNYDLPGAWVGGAMDLRDGAVTMSLDGRSGGSQIAGVDPRRVLYLGLFPNLLVSLHPDYVMTHRLTPLAPDRTAVECSWYFVDAQTDPAYAVEFWDRTNRQDWAACESVQRGLGSPHFRPGPFAPNEDAVHRWVTIVARAYQGCAPHLPAE
ncbi:MAG TPA: aromatic ring-hydroxylating dioxygenase subunit alpha [Actinopolymorphaceae bacterium]|nr:aromatic ring-hydroxylating dioxygenase subunit alpha [Actinopolymorphaceae bacterium]